MSRDDTSCEVAAVATSASEASYDIIIVFEFLIRIEFRVDSRVINRADKHGRYFDLVQLADWSCISVVLGGTLVSE